MLNNIKLRNKLLIIIVLFVVCSVLQGFYSISSLYNELIDEKKVKVKDEVGAAFNLVTHFYKLQDTLGKEESQRQAKEAIRSLRFGKSGYVWINDYQHKLVMHPIKKSKEGKDMTNVKDAKGKYHWQEMVKVATSAKQAGFIHYHYKGPQFTQAEEKVSYVKNFKPWGWVLGSGIYLTEVNSIFYQELISIAIIISIALLMIVVISTRIVKSITTPITELLKTIKKMGQGDFTSRLANTTRQDEIGILSQGIRQMSTNLMGLIQQINNTTTELQIKSQGLLKDSSDASANMQNQNERVQTVTDSMENIQQAFYRMSEDASSAFSTTGVVNEQIEVGANNMQQSIKSIHQLGSSMNSADKTMQTLVAKSKEIDQVVEVISGISEQTNLLALNAAIEAARAGESGRGFAVVADEVRSLAQRTQESTEQIREMIQTLQAFSDSVADEMKKSLEQSEESVEMVEKTNEELEKIIESIKQITQVNQQIARSSKQQSKEVDLVNENLIHINSGAQDTLSTAKNISQISQTIGQFSNSLETEIKKFKLP